MKDIKFYIGPMSQNIIDSIIEYSEENNTKFGFCSTRRQVDYNSGYVGYNTENFIQYVKSKTNKVLICRDHGGISQGTVDDNGIDSMYQDALLNIDIIHIDPWKKYKNYNEGLRETINNILFVHQENKNTLFEVGTEEALRRFETEEFYKFLFDLKSELGEIFNTHIKYAVIQAGTKLLGIKNIGKFNLQRLKEMIFVCKDYNILSKEHNGDYLSDEEIEIRFDLGLNALNIAPEFGVFETKLLMDNIKDPNDIEKIYNICFNGNRWIKWVDGQIDPIKDKINLIEICGHYHNKQIKELAKIEDNEIKNQLKNKIHHLYNIAK